MPATSTEVFSLSEEIIAALRERGYAAYNLSSVGDDVEEGELARMLIEQGPAEEILAGVKYMVAPLTDDPTNPGSVQEAWAQGNDMDNVMGYPMEGGHSVFGQQQYCRMHTFKPKVYHKDMATALAGSYVDIDGFCEHIINEDPMIFVHMLSTLPHAKTLVKGQ